MALHIKDIDTSQSDFQTGTLTDVEADAGGYLRLFSDGDDFSNDLSRWTPIDDADLSIVNGQLKVVTQTSESGGAAFDRTLSLNKRYTVLIDVINDVSESGFICMGVYCRRVGGVWQAPAGTTATNQPAWSPHWRFEVFEDGTLDFYAGGNLVQAGIVVVSGATSPYQEGPVGQTQYYDNFKIIPFAGNRISPQLDLSAVGTVENTLINWNAHEGLSFNGVDAYVGCTTSPNLDQTSFTIEGWFLGKSVADKHVYIGKHSARSANQSLHFGIRAESLVATLAFYGDDINGVSKLSNDVWYHIAGTFNYSTLEQKIYLNGVLENSRTANNGLLNTNDDPLEIMRTFGDTYCHGCTAELRIWDHVRTQDEIRDNMYKRLSGSETGLLVYYPMDEGSGSTLTDLVGDNDGTIFNAKWLSVSIETRVSTDGGSTWTSWAACTNGGSIPGLSGGTDVSNGLLECKQTLSTSDVSTTPKLNSLTLVINSRKFHGASLDIDSDYSLESTVQSSAFLSMDVQALLNSQALLQADKSIAFNLFAESQVTIEKLLSLILESSATNIEETMRAYAEISMATVLPEISQVLLQKALDATLMVKSGHFLMGALQQEARASAADWQKDARPQDTWTKTARPTATNWQKVSKG